MKVYIGADHRGFKLKEQIKVWLIGQGYTVEDCGAYEYDKDDDFPDFSFAVAEKVAAHPDTRGIVICGSAGGVTIAANKVKGIRCVWGVTEEDMEHNRKHDDVNVMGLASDYVSFDDITAIIDVFLKTEYLAEERLVRRLDKIAAREDAWCE